jgi:acetyltransferase (GNAT) family protein
MDKGDRYPGGRGRASGHVVAGAGAGPYRNRSPYTGVAEHSVYVARASRNGGAGRAALEALCGIYAERGFRKIAPGSSRRTPRAFGTSPRRSASFSRTADSRYPTSSCAVRCHRLSGVAWSRGGCVAGEVVGGRPCSSVPVGGQNQEIQHGENDRRAGGAGEHQHDQAAPTRRHRPGISRASASVNRRARVGRAGGEIRRPGPRDRRAW